MGYVSSQEGIFAENIPRDIGSSAQIAGTVFRVFPEASRNSPLYIPLTSCHGGHEDLVLYMKGRFVVVRNGSHFQMAPYIPRSPRNHHFF